MEGKTQDYLSRPVIEVRNYINGRFVELTEEERKDALDVYSPATGAVIARVPRSTSKQVDEAVRAAKAAFKAWSALSERERADYLEKISKRIAEKLEELADIESYDTGKPLNLARTVDIPRARDNFAFFAGQIRHDFTEAHSNAGSGPLASLNYTHRSPVGVAGLITPWNLPLYLLSWKVAPAIGCGNTVVAKPSELTPLTANALAEICNEIGLPPGVFNVVHGTGASAGQALVAHKDVPLISFTGGTATGAIVNSTAAPLFKKVSLELGGKNATVIFDDVNLDEIMPSIVRSAFANQGQVCLCGSRILVHEKIYETFVEKFAQAVKTTLIPGDPRTSNFGAVISADHMKKVLSYIELAKQEGGTIVCGGKRADLPQPFKNGYFIEPTVVTGLATDSRCAQEEVFGPFVTVHPFKDEAQALEICNSTRYGLAGSLWTNDLKRGHRFAQQWETGMVWVNTWLLRDLRVPFGGVKDSGFGREGGRYAFEFWTNQKNVCIKL